MVWHITLFAPPARMDDVYCIPSPNTPIGCTHEGYSMLTSGWRHHSSTNCPSWPSSSLRRWVSFPGASTTAATVSCGKNIECSILEPPGPLLGSGMALGGLGPIHSFRQPSGCPAGCSECKFRTSPRWRSAPPGSAAPGLARPSADDAGKGRRKSPRHLLVG